MAIIKNGALFGKYHYAFAIMIGCCFLQAFGMGLILNSSSLFVVPVSTELGFTRASFSTYMTGYFLGTIIATPIAGTLLQNHNIRVVMSIAVVFLSGATIMMSTYTEMWQWQISGLIWGLAGAFVFVLPAAMLIGNWFVKRKGVMYGIVMAFSGIGGAVFSQVINGIILADGWRTGYLLMGILCLCFILPWTLFVFRNKPADMNMLPYGFVASAETMAECKEKVPPMRGVACKKAIVSVSFVCLFIFAGIAAFCHSGIDTHLPAHIVSIGFSSAFGATILSAMSIGSVADKLIMGWLNDKLGVQRTTIIQLGMVTRRPYRVFVRARTSNLNFCRDPIRNSRFFNVGKRSVTHQRNLWEHGLHPHTLLDKGRSRCVWTVCSNLRWLAFRQLGFLYISFSISCRTLCNQRFLDCIRLPL